MMRDNPNEWLPLVDEEGTVIGRATRGECHGGTMWLHPVVHLHVFNTAGELFLQHRPVWKDIQPDKWDTAVGGHVDDGETVAEALRREAREELGLTEFAPAFIARRIYQSLRERELIYAYRTVTDVQLKPSSELDGGRFFARAEILQRLGTGFFTPGFENEWQELFGNEALG